MVAFNVACFVLALVLGLTNGSPAGLDRCSRCQKMISSFNAMVDEQTRDDMLDSICETFSADDRDLCSKLSHLPPAQLCQHFGQCDPSQFLYEPSWDITTDLGISDVEGFQLPCMLCKNVMKIAHAFLQSKKHQKFLEHMLKSVCHFIPFLSKECTSFVDRYGNLAIHLIAQYLNPESCKLFHICPAGQDANSTTAFTGDECAMCRLGVGVIYDAVQDPDLETRIQELTHDICDEYVDTDAECESMAQELAPYLIPLAEELRHSGFLKYACERANICSEDEDNDFTID